MIEKYIQKKKRQAALSVLTIIARLWKKLSSRVWTEKKKNKENQSRRKRFGAGLQSKILTYLTTH